MTALPGHIEAGLALESRIAAMAPAEPSLPRLLEALRFLEASLGEDFTLVVDAEQDARLTRKFKSGKMRTSWNLGIQNGAYVNRCMTGADTYQEVYPGFVAAAFRFAGKSQPSIAAAAFAKRQADKAASGSERRADPSAPIKNGAT